ncbi:acetyl-CoA carboxylase, biotin carboxylase subunit [Shimia gijangensis]|uniref:biotin carboxylase n=1 Tax=Shimia gijangensis TaxID=1470563 RepID=A0A1M6T7X0_9RHOB|nr:biotin carboxylase N-terminal domain-containing protein [Shimia gijangensis]SHK53087.1 acetyl-CoA carboxylase, biotin carboxylase subunit [Shimia gijangensis]
MAEKNELRRILIANRGEIALRAIRVCRRIGLETVAIYSTADASSAHVWAADKAVCVGPAAAQKSYLSAKAVVHIALETGCDGVYPGYGFLAENAEFADLCSQNGIKFIGPSAETISTMGNKSKAREVAVSLGVPVVPGSDQAFDKGADARAVAEGVGFPILLKARSGGGGRGMRIVNQASEFEQAFVEAHREAEAAFDDGAIYLERFFRAVRHIEIQVFGDGKGGSIEFDERDCSVQRRHQKLIEESPSPIVSEDQRRDLRHAARLLTRGTQYEGAGTVEFILDTASGEFFFIEMNTRIQVEHTVTEMRVDMDLIELQFSVAQGHPLPETSSGKGHAIEFRVNAEDWTNGFSPSPGNLTRWQPPQGQGIRLDSAVGSGQNVVPFYDSMIAKLIVYGDNRDQALERSHKALAAFRVTGLCTTIGFHRLLIDHPDFADNAIHTRWIEEVFSAGQEA